jgi:hypothetical protein
MALYWTIDSRQQLVVVTADGDVTHDDAEEYLAAIEGAAPSPIASSTTAGPATS